jgi:hypothetical protein
MATIQGVYLALFGRPADPAGLAFFNAATNNGADLTAIGDLSSTDEYQDRFTGLSNEEIINSIYQSLFGRDAEPAGLTFFATALTNNTLNINNIAIAILDSAQNDDLADVNAKLAAADLFNARLDLQVEIDAYSGNDAAAIARNYISNVDANDAGTESEADAAIAQMLALPGQGPGEEPTPEPIPGVTEIEAVGSVSFNDAKEGALLTVVDNITDGNGSIIDRDYQWQKFEGGVWVDVVGETNSTYQVSNTQSEVGDEIRVVVTTTDDSFNTTTFVSADDVIQNVNDVPVLSSAAQAATTSAENNVARILVADLTVSDFDGALDTITYELTGDNASAFEIFNGDLYLKAGANFETDSTLNVTVNVDDGTVNSNSLNFSYTLTNVSEAGVADTFVLTAGNNGTINPFEAADQISTNYNPNNDDYDESNGQFSIFGFTVTKSFADLVNEANSHFNPNDEDVYVVYNAENTGNAYVFQDTNGSGTYDAGDSFVILAGVNLASEISSANFI